MLLPLAASAQSQKKVLLLNSYSYTLGWTASITRGVEEALKDAPVKLVVEFMDTKNHVSDEYYENLAQQYRIKYGQTRFDVIIASDDNAVNFILDHRGDIFGDVPVVFCGVNNVNLPSQPNFRKMTGILESPDTVGTINSALILQPGLRTIYCVIDETTSGRNLRADADRVMSIFQDHVQVVWLQGLSIAELEQRLAGIPKESAVLLMSFTRDRLGQSFTFLEVLDRIYQVCNRPIYGLFDFYLGGGIVGGMLTTGTYQGIGAGEMALRILGGEKAEDIPLATGSANRYMFDWNELQRFEMNIMDLPPESIIINKPVSFYDQHQIGVWSVVGVIFFLVGVILTLLVNIRRRKLAEKNLEELNLYQETLIDQRTEELVQRSKDLEIANYELKKVDELKTAVLNTVSHDLRTPLTSVLGFCKIIHRDFNRYFLPLCKGSEELDSRGERIRGNLGIIEEEGERLTRLINDFLDLSKIESGRIAWNDVSVDPERLITQAKPVLEGYFSQSDVELEVNIKGALPRVVIDPDRFLQVLSNLVSNAAKFTRKGGVVLTATANEGGWLQVTVDDTGIGIPGEEIEYVFNKFYQACHNDPDNVIARGSGMGLAITKRIIEHYGGAITVDSTPNRGSSFTFTIPSAG